MSTDQDLLRDLLARRYRHLVRELVAVTGRLAEAEDAVQDAFARALAHSHPPVDEDEALARVRATAIRLTRSRRWQLARSVAPTAAFHEVSDVAAEEAAHEGLTELQRVVALPRPQREVLGLRLLIGFSPEATSQALDRPGPALDALLESATMSLGSDSEGQRLHALREAATAVAATAATPTVPGLLERARSARRKERTMAVATVAAIALLVALVAPHIDFTSRHRMEATATTTSPFPTMAVTPSLVPLVVTSPLDLTADQVISQGKAVGLASDGPFRQLELWSVCRRSFDVCIYAWEITRNSGKPLTGTLRLPDTGGQPFVTPAGSGYLLSIEGLKDLLLRPDGSTVKLHAGDPRPVEPDSVAVPGGSSNKSVELLDPQTGETWRVPGPPPLRHRGPLSNATVGADGTLWVDQYAAPGPSSIWWLTANGWQRHVVPVTGAPDVIAVSNPAGSATRVAVANSATTPNNYGNSIASLSVTTDGGATWRDVDVSALPFKSVGSMAASRSGTLYVTDMGWNLWRSTDASWTRFERVKPAIGLRVFVSRAGGKVMAQVITKRPFQGAVQYLPGGPGAWVVVTPATHS